MSPYIKLLWFPFFLLSCQERALNFEERMPTPQENLNLGYLKLIKSSEFRPVMNTPDGVYTGARFLDYEIMDVWGVFVTRNGKRERISLELEMDKPRTLMLYTDKYLDYYGNRRISVFGSVANTGPDSIEMVNLAVVDSGSGRDFDQYFRVIEPTHFGTIVNTPQGQFVEAFFVNLNPEDVWIILKTLQQGTRLQVNISRRMADKPVFHYLKRGSRFNEMNIELHGIKVGLPYEPKTPFQNIEVVVERKN